MIVQTLHVKFTLLRCTHALNLFLSTPTAELRKYPSARKVLLVLSLLMLSSAIVLRFMLSARLIPLDFPGVGFADGASGVLAIAGSVLLIISIASFTSVDFRKLEKQLESELESLLKERNELRARIANEDAAPIHSPADVLDTIRLNLNQLTEYYTINKGQAKSSFRASMGAMLIGLLSIVVGIWIYYAQSSGSIKIASLSAIAGLVAEFIAAAYFYLYNRSITQLNY